MADAAAAIILLVPTPATVTAMTGNRRRSLTQAELSTAIANNNRAIPTAVPARRRIYPQRSRPVLPLTSALHRGRGAQITEPGGS